MKYYHYEMIDNRGCVVDVISIGKALADEGVIGDLLCAAVSRLKGTLGTGVHIAQVGRLDEEDFQDMQLPGEGGIISRTLLSNSRALVVSSGITPFQQIIRQKFALVGSMNHRPAMRLVTVETPFSLRGQDNHIPHVLQNALQMQVGHELGFVIDVPLVIFNAKQAEVELNVTDWASATHHQVAGTEEEYPTAEQDPGNVLGHIGAQVVKSLPIPQE